MVLGSNCRLERQAPVKFQAPRSPAARPASKKNFTK